MSTDENPDRAATLAANGRIALRVEGLSESEFAALMASEPVSGGGHPDHPGGKPHDLADLPDVDTSESRATGQGDGGGAIEHWWAEVDGRGGLRPVEVMRRTGLGEYQDPPRPWHAHVAGSEEILWPDRVRLVRRIPHPDATEIRVLFTEDGRLMVKATGSPSMQIVTSRDWLPAAAGQRVAELVREALDARARAESGVEPVPSEEFLGSLRMLADRRRAARKSRATLVPSSTKDGGR